MNEIDALILNSNVRQMYCSVCNLLLLKDETNILAFSFTGRNGWYHKQCAENVGKAAAFIITAYLHSNTVVYEYHLPQKEKEGA